MYICFVISIIGFKISNICILSFINRFNRPNIRLNRCIIIIFQFGEFSFFVRGKIIGGKPFARYLVYLIVPVVDIFSGNSGKCFKNCLEFGSKVFCGKTFTFNFVNLIVHCLIKSFRRLSVHLNIVCNLFKRVHCIGNNTA